MVVEDEKHALGKYQFGEEYLEDGAGEVDLVMLRQGRESA